MSDSSALVSALLLLSIVDLEVLVDQVIFVRFDDVLINEVLMTFEVSTFAFESDTEMLLICVLDIIDPTSDDLAHLNDLLESLVIAADIFLLNDSIETVIKFAQDILVYFHNGSCDDNTCLEVSFRLINQHIE